jgi:hypothetical protein
MSTPSDDQPTVQQAAAQQPRLSAAPATRRARIWQHKVPARIGRARTSTVVIGCLWLVLFAVNLSLPQNTYTTVTTDSGQTVRVRTADLTGVPAAPATRPGSEPAPASSPSAPAGSSAPSSATSSTPGQQTATTAPRTTTPAPRTTVGTSTTAPTGTTGASPSSSPVPSAATPVPTGTAAPTT